MLQLSRKIGQAIVIDESIEICVLEIQGKHVKLGITCPATTRVLRQEIYLRIQEANKAALESAQQIPEEFFSQTSLLS